MEFKEFKLIFLLIEVRRGWFFVFFDEYVRYGGFLGIVDYFFFFKIRMF